jgi:primosomal protein N'
VIIQTFRPQALQVIAAAEHQTEQYLDDELKLRVHAGYPPAAQMIRLIARGQHAEKRARALYTSALTARMQTASDTKISVSPTLFGAGKEWHVLLRGADPRALLGKLDLHDAVVDVDPTETL